MRCECTCSSQSHKVAKSIPSTTLSTTKTSSPGHSPDHDVVEQSPPASDNWHPWQNRANPSLTPPALPRKMPRMLTDHCRPSPPVRAGEHPERQRCAPRQGGAGDARVQRGRHAAPDVERDPERLRGRDTPRGRREPRRHGGAWRARSASACSSTERNRGYGGNQKTCYREALERGADYRDHAAPGLPVRPALPAR